MREIGSFSKGTEERPGASHWQALGSLLAGARTLGVALALGMGGATASIAAQAKSEPARQLCEAKSQDAIKLVCDYATTTDGADNAASKPPIAIQHAEFSFETKHDNHMRVDLTFAGARPAREARTVYLEIDDDAGRNFIRRPLPDVDFRKLEPGAPLATVGHLLVPALQPGRYHIYLWIPSADPALQFKPAHNFLLNSAGVADKATGLNKLAAFTVER